MGRPRKIPSQGLPTRLYLRSGTAWYVRPDGKWVKLGRNLDEAIRLARQFNRDQPVAGTMAYWLDEWVKELDARVKAGHLAARTRADYVDALKPLKVCFGAMAPQSIQPRDVAAYLALGRNHGRSVRANRERAALSACFTWLVINGHGGVTINPCRGVPRNPETERKRYVEDDEFTKVMNVAPASVKAWAELIYRTLQRPADILRWTHANIIAVDGQRFLQFQQSKTKAWLKIVMTPSLEGILAAVAATREVKSRFLISREDGLAYTEHGLASMFRKATVAAKVKDFAPYDLKAKGATDLYQAGRPIEEISALCGHDSVKTTEIYVKQHLRRAVQPNERVINTTKP